MKKIRLSGIIIYTLVTLFSLCCILPMVLVFMVSITDERAIGMNGYSFFPEAFSLEAVSKNDLSGIPSVQKLWGDDCHGGGRDVPCGDNDLLCGLSAG